MHSVLSQNGKNSTTVNSIVQREKNSEFIVKLVEGVVEGKKKLQIILTKIR